MGSRAMTCIAVQRGICSARCTSIPTESICISEGQTVECARLQTTRGSKESRKETVRHEDAAAAEEKAR